MATLRFEVAGLPIPQGSKVAFVQRGRAVMKDDNEKELHAWRDLVASRAETTAHYAGWQQLDSPVMVTLTAFIPKPPGTRFKEFPAGPPDVDKLQRAVGDALTQSGVIKDDARIVQWIAGKRWAPDPARPFVALTIEPFPRRQS